MTTGNDQIFEKLVDDFTSVEADENKNVDEQGFEEVDEKKKPPMCKKCNKKHWPFQKCSAKESTVEEDAEEIGDVWKFESPDEEEAADYLGDISQKALEGDEKAQKFLEKIFDEKWESIKPKLEAEGSVYYVWWMDGVRNLLSKRKGQKATEGKSPVEGDKEATQIKKLTEEEKDLRDKLIDYLDDAEEGEVNTFVGNLISEILTNEQVDRIYKDLFGGKKESKNE